MTTPTQSIIDIEEYAKAERAVPPFEPGTEYRIRIDKDQKVVDVPSMNGAQILALVNKKPETHRLDQKLHGGKTKEVKANDSVNFTEPGLEKFMTLPRDQTDGARILEGK